MPNINDAFAAEAKSRLGFELAPSLDLKAAASLKMALMDCLGGEGPAVITASGVMRVSTATVQILAAFAIAMRQAGRKLTLSQPSPVLLAAFESLGLASLFQPAMADD